MCDVTYTLPEIACAITARLFVRRTSFVDATKSLRGNRHGRGTFYLVNNDPVAGGIAMLMRVSNSLHKQATPPRLNIAVSLYRKTAPIPLRLGTIPIERKRIYFSLANSAFIQIDLYDLILVNGVILCISIFR